jgi:hypothetical protein
MYTLQDFARIQQDGFECSIPVVAFELIQRIATTVGAATYCPTPVFPGKKKRRDREGVDKVIADVVSHLNKLSEDSYAVEARIIVALVGELEGEDLERVGTVLLDICSANKFFAKMYAKLFAALPALHGLLPARLEKHKAEFETLKSCDPEDYDLFCELKLAADKRAAFSAFVLGLVECKVLPRDTSAGMVAYLQGLIEARMDNGSRKAEIDEIVDHLFQFATQTKVDVAVFQKMANLSRTDHPGLTNKTLFRYLDIVEFYQ